jgi:DNA modification methylase
MDEILTVDCLSGLQKIPSNSVDLVFTDPPYGINKEGIINDDSLRIYHKVLPLLFDKLKDGKFFVTFASIGNLPNFFKRNPFIYRWQYIIYINNGMVRGSIGFNRYIIALIFQKGNAKLSKPLLDVFEVSTSSKQCSQRKHPTEKRIDVCRKLIEALSKKGDVVLDPFMGSGTTAVACKQLNRHFIGFEIDLRYWMKSKERLAFRLIDEKYEVNENVSS